MRRILIIIGLQIYALILALYHYSFGVHTDEAKYLLDIPYPHPPLIRSILQTVDHELFWRIIFATILIQSIWIVWSIGKNVQIRSRICLSTCWLVTPAVIFQTGTIMMAPLTAVQGLIFLWLYTKQKRESIPRNEMIWMGIGLLWLASLFTAYQALLFAPIVIAIFSQSKVSLWKKILYVCVPVGLLLLYSLTNPLALASMLSIGTNAAVDSNKTMVNIIMILIVAGSGIGLIFGLIGLFLKPRWPIIITFLLIVLYIIASPKSYYAILLVPFFVIGIHAFFKKYARSFLWISAVYILNAIVIVAFLFPEDHSNFARDVSASAENAQGKSLLIVGSFGHEWQYYWPGSILRYTEGNAAPTADYVLCIAQCPEEVLESEAIVINYNR